VQVGDGGLTMMFRIRRSRLLRTCSLRSLGSFVDNSSSFCRRYDDWTCCRLPFHDAAYSAQTKLMIDTGRIQVLRQPVLGDDLNWQTLDSQIEILKSENLALKIIESLHLTRDPEFIGPARGLLALRETQYQTSSERNRNPLNLI
jgi:hypothetical protein